MSSQFYLQSDSTSDASLAPSISHSSRPDSSHQAQSAARSPSPRTYNRRNPPTSLNITLSNDSHSSDDSDTDVDLPFPAPLPRSDFLIPGDFDPSAYLTTVVKERYQTLEDLRGELRTRVQSLNQELVELVNAHQEEFMGLGASMKGGEERIEELRVGVLGLRREVEDVRKVLVDRERDVKGWLGQRRKLRGELELGRGLLKFEELLEGLEVKLRLKGMRSRGEIGEGSDDGEVENGTSEEEEEDEDVESIAGISYPRLSRRVEDLLRIARLAERVGDEHPFIGAQRQRVAKCRAVILSDLNTCLKQIQTTRTTSPERKIELLRLYREVKFGESNSEPLDWL